MNCEELKNLIPDLLTGETAPRNRAAVDDHLSVCGSCAEDFRRVTETWTRLGVLPNVSPSPALRDRFYAMLEAYREGVETRNGQNRVRISKATGRGFFFRRPAFQLAAAAALLLLGIFGGVSVGRTGSLGGRIGRLQAEVDDLRQTTALSLLRQPSSSERLLGVSYSEQVRSPKQPTIEALLRTLDEDSSINVRLAAAEALYLFAGDRQVREGVTASLARQTSPLVQIALIDLLVESREKRAAEALKALIQRGAIVPEVKQRAELGLRQIASS